MEKRKKIFPRSSANISIRDVSYSINLDIQTTSQNCFARLEELGYTQYVANSGA